MVKCPYCSNNENYEEDIERIINTKSYYNPIWADSHINIRQNFFVDTTLQHCVRASCGKTYYKTKVEKGIPVYLTIEEFKRLERKFSDNISLINFLPETIVECCEEMVKVFQSDCGVRSMSTLLRATIEAYTLHIKQSENKKVTEIKNSLKKEIDKLSHLNDSTKKILADILVAETQQGAHIKPILPDIDILKKGYLFLEILFTKEFKIPKELENSREKYEKEKEAINKQLEELEKELIDNKKE